MSAKYRAAVIGCGRIGMRHETEEKRLKPATHVGAWINHPDVELIAVADKDPESLQIAREHAYCERLFDDGIRLLEETRPNIVSIATMDDGKHNHFEFVRAAAKNEVRAIVCEKPLADSIEIGEQMVHVCKQVGVMLFVNHIRRFDPALQRVREEIASGSLGKVYQVSGWYAIGLYHMGTHLIDFLHFLFGNTEWVSGATNFEVKAAVEGDNCVDALMRLPESVTATIQSVSVNKYSMFEVRILGEKGEIFIRDLGNTIERTPVRPSRIYDRFFELDPALREREVSTEMSYFASLARHVVDCLNGRSTPISSGEDALKTLRVLAALRQSGEEDGKKIHIT
jgi:predicted dehydrogenase